MKLVHMAAIATGLIILIGVALVAPAFFRSFGHSDAKTPVLLAFDVLDVGDARATSVWCKDLSALLDERQIKAAVFLSGKMAEAAPECVSSFSSGIDIGSRTYSYLDIVALGDYTKALDEVEKGKQAIDRTGNLDSALFRAPYGSADANIYSLLNRSGILADFTYGDHYNKYENGLFVKHEIRTLSGSQATSDAFDKSPIPVVVNFDNTAQIGQIADFIDSLDSSATTRFVNASELTGMDLAARRSGQS
jgi:peptidoglycan/xylan/chitin deacetylase (PgdA/CDA1 family)